MAGLPRARPRSRVQKHKGPSKVRSAHLRIAVAIDDYCLSRVFVTVMSLSDWLSTEYSVNGWYISSQLCSDQ